MKAACDAKVIYQSDLVSVHAHSWFTPAESRLVSAPFKNSQCLYPAPQAFMA